MAIRDDFQRLMDKFRHESDKKGNVDLLSLFKESLFLFEKLKDRLTQASEEEKKEIFAVMAEMHTFLLNETKKLAEKTGLTEEQLLRYSENPDNFNANQWKALEAVKERLNKTSSELTQIIKEGSKKDKISDKSKDGEPSSVKRIKKAHKPKKGGWMRS